MEWTEVCDVLGISYNAKILGELTTLNINKNVLKMTNFLEYEAREN